MCLIIKAISKLYHKRLFLALFVKIKPLKCPNQFISSFQFLVFYVLKRKRFEFYYCNTRSQKNFILIPNWWLKLKKLLSQNFVFNFYSLKSIIANNTWSKVKSNLTSVCPFLVIVDIVGNHGDLALDKNVHIIFYVMST